MVATIRRLRPEDAGDFQAIRLCSLRTDPESFGSTYEVEASRPLAAVAERAAGSFIVGAYAEGTIVGLAGFTRDAGPQEGHKGHVWGVFVMPEHRRTGLALALMQAILAHADATVAIVTLSVTGGKTAAIGLYEGLGFTTYGTLPCSLRRGGRCFDEILMLRATPGNELLS